METGFYVSLVGAICFIILIISLIVISNRPISNVLKLVRSFPEGVDNEKVKSILSILKTTDFVNNQPSIWGALRSGFEIVADSPNVDFQFKKELRIKLLSLGVERLKTLKKI